MASRSSSKAPGRAKPPANQTSTAGVQVRREALSEQFRQLVDSVGAEPQTRELLMAILEAKAAPDDQQAQLLALSRCLAEVIENPFTPAGLYNSIADELTDITNEHGGGGSQERDLRAGAFVSLMASTTNKSGEGVARG